MSAKNNPKSTGDPVGDASAQPAEAEMATKLSVASADADVLAEIQGLVLTLARTRGRDGLSTIGHLLTAGLKGQGGLPVWRDKYNDGKPFEKVPPSNPDKPRRLSITSLDPYLLAEAKGFALWLAAHGARDGLATMGDIVSAALAGTGDLPKWRKKYNKGRKFELSQSVPPGRK